MMKLIIKTLCNIHSFMYFLIGQLATRINHGISPKHEIMKYHDFFLENITANDTVLDVGCGNGIVTRDLSKKAREIIGIDILNRSIQKARKDCSHKNVQFICGDATKYTFKTTFNAIILSNVLEHIENRVEFLHRIRPLSKKFLIRVPMIDRDWLTLYKESIGAVWLLDNTHYTEYTFASFKKELDLAGLHIKKYSIQFGEIWAVAEYE